MCVCVSQALICCVCVLVVFFWECCYMWDLLVGVSAILCFRYACMRYVCWVYCVKERMRARERERSKYGPCFLRNHKLLRERDRQRGSSVQERYSLCVCVCVRERERRMQCSTQMQNALRKKKIGRM